MSRFRRFCGSPPGVNPSAGAPRRFIPPPPTAPIAPADVHRLLARHMLADGLDLVFDYDRSHRSWLYDSRHGREYLDFMTFFGSTPIGYNHPKMKDPEFPQGLSRVDQLKPSLADVPT